MRFFRTLRISFEGTWRGIFEPGESNFLAIAWSANTGAISRVPWHEAIGLSLRFRVIKRNEGNDRDDCIGTDADSRDIKD